MLPRRIRPNSLNARRAWRRKDPRELTLKNKTEVLASLKSGDEKLESVEISDQRVRVIGNTAAVETGTVKFKGLWKGKAFEETERYTTTWVWRGGRWQSVTDHTSAVKP